MRLITRLHDQRVLIRTKETGVENDTEEELYDGMVELMKFPEMARVAS